MKHLSPEDFLRSELVHLHGQYKRFYREIAERVGGPVLDLAGGRGCLAVSLALAGHDVTAVEVSPALLRVAREEAERSGVAITFVSGDLQEYDLDESFGLVIASCSSLCRLLTNAELTTTLRNAGRRLAPGGLLAFDIPNPNVRALSPPLSTSVELQAGPGGGPWRGVEDVVAYDAVHQVRVTQWRIEGARESTHEVPERHRVIFPQELDLLLDVAGFELAARYGDFDESPFTSVSPRQVCLARARLA